MYGCGYDSCYEIHRLIEGQHDGKYEVGNMFAICPNHHTEAHRGLIKFEKISDCKLMATTNNSKNKGYNDRKLVFYHENRINTNIDFISEYLNNNDVLCTDNLYQEIAKYLKIKTGSYWSKLTIENNSMYKKYIDVFYEKVVLKNSTKA